MNNFKFTFETEDDYMKAVLRGYIDDFDIVRINVKYRDGHQVDFPIKNREDFEKTIKRLNENNVEIIEIYQAQHYYDINEYYD